MSECKNGLTKAHNFQSLLLKSEFPNNLGKISGLSANTIEAMKTKTYIIICTKCGERINS